MRESHGKANLNSESRIHEEVLCYWQWRNTHSRLAPKTAELPSFVSRNWQLPTLVKGMRTV